MEVEDFFPKYPNINDSVGLPPYMNPYKGVSFEQAIYNKKEFTSLKVTKEDEKENESDSLFKHQKVISRFLSSYTPYDALLLFHEMGTGKTCAAFGAIEHLRKTDKRYDGAIIVTTNPSILNSLIEQLAKVCTKNMYLPTYIDDITKVDPKKLIAEIKATIKKTTDSFYEFNTLETFTSILEKKTRDEMIVRDYSNKIIIIDEVHNVKLYGQGNNKQSNTYKQISRLLHLPKNCKKIVMSGTPMTDKASEIADIMNLVLPTEKKFPVLEDFEREYLVSDENNIKRLRLDKVKDFKNKIRGYVSYLKASLSNIQTEYVGRVVRPPLTHFRVVENPMSQHQKQAYQTAFAAYEKQQGGEVEAEKKKHDVYRSVEQASLFVFPDSTFGKDGYEKYVKEKLDFRNQIASLFEGKTVEEKLHLLERYSSTYAKTIRFILENPRHNTLVFNSAVHGSGVILFTKLLELFNFRSSFGIENTVAKRYALITADLKDNLTPIKNLFNDPKNKNGEFLQVIIFSATIAEGVSFSNVQEIHIQTPHWNYSQTSQVIARGLRLRSHQALIQAGQKPIVKIYQHCAIADERELNKSIDMYKYSKSESKDISAKNIEHYIKEAAVDCQIFYERNVIPAGESTNGTRVCDYMPCEYQCEGITNINNFDMVDVSTYQLYYISEKINPIIVRIMQIFRRKFSMSLANLHRDEVLSQYTQFELLFAIRQIIAENVIIKNAYGFDSYLRENKNIFFLSSDLSTGSDFLCASYTRYPIGIRKASLKDAIDNEIIRKILIPQLRDCQTVEDVGRVIPLFTSAAKKKLIEQVLFDPENKDFQLSLAYFTQKGIILSESSYTLGDKTYTWIPDQNVWEEIEAEKRFELPKKDLAGFAGLEDPDKPGLESFKIQNVGKTKKAQAEGQVKRQHPGRACKNFDDPPRSHLLILIGAKISPDMEKVLKSLETFLEKNAEYAQFHTLKEKLLAYLKSNFNKELVKYYSKEDDISVIRKAVVFLGLKPTSRQCQLLYDTFKEEDCLYADPDAGKGYRKSKKALMQGAAAAQD
uniref:Helicase ATP-binding domain-containing protein n=1 Tax=viral metagenome TaxID=1070528 RepID=A0A6C0KUT1_9ZZZZ